MAPDNGEDLVSNVKIEGTEQSAAELEALGQKGSAAFDDLAKSANRADAAINKATGGINEGATRAAGGLEKINKTKVDPNLAKNLKAVEVESQRLGASIRTLAPQIGSFAARITALATGFAAAGVALAAGARNMVSGLNATNDALGDNLKAQQASNDRAGDAEVAVINHTAALRQLQQSLARGEITYTQYSEAVQKANRDFREQQRVANEVANAQERTKEANERLAKQVADTKAYQKLTDAMGGPLTSAMLQFGNNAESVRRSLVATFSPAIAAVIDVISAALTKNAGGIDAFAKSAAASIEQFINTNGPAINKALESMGRAAAAVFQGLIDAAPAILDFFNNQLVPAVNGLVAAFQAVADVINAAFGTRITAGFLILSVVIAQLTGSIILFFGLLRTGAALFTTLSAVAAAFGIPLAGLIAIIAAVVAGLYLLMQIDWSQLVTRAQTAAAAVLAAFQALPAKITAFFKTLWDGVVALATAAVQAIIDAWNGIVEFFNGLITTVSEIFTQVWESVKAITQAAFDAMLATISGWVTSVLAFLQPVIDAISAITSFLASGAAGEAGGGAQGFSGGGHVRGAGTSTSDSIWARLSDNEFVMRAKAVRKYGVGLMNALNSGKLDLGRMLGYAAGGLVSGMRGNPAPKMAFADGGQVNARALRPLSLTIEGQTFEGLLMPEDVAGKLTKFAVARQTSSAGRKPAWVGGRR